MAKKMGRPKIEIDQGIFEGLCGIQCSKKEICQVLNITKRTLERWCKRTYDMTFVAVFNEKRVTGIISLRRHGFKLAETNAAVWIFHAKNILGMTDRIPDLGLIVKNPDGTNLLSDGIQISFKKAEKKKEHD